MAIEAEFSNAKSASLGVGVVVKGVGWEGCARLIERSDRSLRSGSGLRDVPQEALDGVGLSLAAEIEIDASATENHDAPPGARGIGGPPAIYLVVETPRSDCQYGVLCQDKNSGISRWIFPSSDVAETAFELPSTPPIRGRDDDPDRGLLTSGLKLLARIVSWASAGVIGTAALGIAREWEARRRPHKIVAVDESGATCLPDWSSLSSGRTLLLVHGTFSTPEAGFAGLFGSNEFRKLLARYDGRCLALAHPTMSPSLEENVAWVRSAIPNSAKLDVDIVSHSRGGLIARALAAGAHAGNLPLNVGAVVMVGAPNRGTPLVDARHWIEFLDRYTNILDILPDTVATVTLEGVLLMVKVIGSGFTGGLPGLAAMDTNEEQLAALSRSTFGKTKLFAIASDFRPEANSRLRLLATAGHNGVEDFFGEANDLVVPTNGCYDLTHAEGFPLPNDRIWRCRGSKTYHLNFLNPLKFGRAWSRCLEQNPIIMHRSRGLQRGFDTLAARRDR